MCYLKKPLTTSSPVHCQIIASICLKTIYWTFFYILQVFLETFSDKAIQRTHLSFQNTCAGPPKWASNYIKRVLSEQWILPKCVLLSYLCILDASRHKCFSSPFKIAMLFHQWPQKWICCSLLSIHFDM